MDKISKTSGDGFFNRASLVPLSPVEVYLSATKRNVCRYGKLLLWEGVFVKAQEGADWGTFRYAIPEPFFLAK